MKYECIRYYQKRVGNRLRNLRKKTKGLGGKNKKSKVVDVVSSQKTPKQVMKAKSRLTDSLIDKLQNYFGIALRSNVGNVKDMQNAILASMFHVASSYDNNFARKHPIHGVSTIVILSTRQMYMFQEAF